jgi:sugar phosphate isomerase/epimerase
MAALTYCSNIHPGESWSDVMYNLESHALEVKSLVTGAVAQQSPFPLGLRLSHQAVSEMDQTAIDTFRAWCEQHDCYLLTINGFPYGAFHGQKVKERVYLPDWRQPERVAYTKRLGDLATLMQPDAQTISISTVPVAFKQGFLDADWDGVFANIREVLAHFVALKERTGIKIMLAIEPEPACVLETTSEVIDFFQRLRPKLNAQEDEHLGLCFDCCHQAVEFEDPAECLQRLDQAQITIAKVQVSSALRAVTDGEIRRLLKFDEPVYLHQAVARQPNGELKHYPDLPEFTLALDTGAQVDECRVHFHVPIFLEHLGDCGTTQDFLRAFLPKLGPEIPLEVETYSFGVLPEHLRTDSVGKSIARELDWVADILN